LRQDSFQNIVLDVFQSFTKTFFNYSPTCTVANSTKKHGPCFDNIIFITILGELEGAFILEIDSSSVDSLLSAINQVGIKEQVDINTLVKGYIGEFGNVLASKIVTNLGKNFGNTFLSTPSLFSGIEIDTRVFYDKTYTAYIEYDIGVLKVSLSMKS
jgi:CheY-specific phosphatase CheX